MSREAENRAVEKLEPFRQQESVRLLADVLKARIERHRDRLEREENAEARGALRELRELLKILSE